MEPGLLLLYGGVAIDGSALNDAWIFEAQSRSWQLVFNADASLLASQGGALSTIRDGKLISLTISSASNKLDICMTLDPFSLQQQFGFVSKMKEASGEILAALEDWVQEQHTGLELASNPSVLETKFDSLLVVMDALFKAH